MIHLIEKLESGVFILNILMAAFLAILFLQSGLDKVVDWKGNLSWLKGHFSKTMFKNSVPLMLLLITFTELLAGGLSLIGIFEIVMQGTTKMALWGAEFSALNLVMLFFGQRIAKDYEGAASLVNYFILTALAIILFG
jgi:hypothetical protein